MQVTQPLTVFSNESYSSSFKVDEAFNQKIVAESAAREDQRRRDSEESKSQREKLRLEGLKPEEVPGGGGIGSIRLVRKEF